MIINLSRIDFGGVATGGGNAKPEEVFDVQPTTSDQTITPTEGSVFSGGTVRAVTSAIDNNIVAGNIKEGVSILGVAGSHKGEKPEETFNVQPTTSEQTITPTEGSVFSGGTVHAVTSAIDGNIQPENIKEGVSILGVEGTLSAGSDVFVVPPEIRFAYSKFTEIPSNFDFSNITDLNSMFYSCKQLTTIPLLDTSKVTDMGNMLSGTQLTTIPLLDTSNVTNMHNMFASCKQLTTIPLLDTSKVTDMGFMFQGCTLLTTIPQLDTSNVTNMEYMFAYIPNLTTIPQLDTTKVTNMGSMFSGCSSLTTIPQLDTSKVTKMGSMFSSCSSLTTVEGIDFSGLTSDLQQLFGYTSSMPKLTRFIVNGKINVSIIDNYSIKALTAIDYDSVKSILAAAERTDAINIAKTLTFNRTMTDQNGELAALVSSCTHKNWTIYGLTLK